MKDLPGQRIKAGNFYLELPKGSSLPSVHPSAAAPPVAEKSDRPEALEESQYIYRPNDAFQSSVDEARAIASISASHKPWVRKTWFILFVIGPLVYAELFALALISRGEGVNSWKAFLSANAFIAPVWLLYYALWRKNGNK
jgi:hypothetical protein